MLALVASAVSTSVMALGVRQRRRHPLLSLGDAAGRDQLHRLGDLLRRLGRADPPAKDPNLAGHRLTPSFGGTARLTRLTVSLVSTPSAIASASSSLTTGMPSAARNICLNVAIASSSAATMSSSQSFGRDLRRAWPCASGAGTAGTRARTGAISPTGTSSSLPSVPAQIETTCSSTGYGRVVRLLEQLDQARAAVQLVARGPVQVGGEGGERLQLAELGQVQPQPAGDLASSAWPAPRHRPGRPRCPR